MKEYLIRDIESLTEPEAKTLAIEELTIKGYSVYLIDFSGYFGYSACVFKNGKHIRYANDYELHHPGKTHEELRALYVKALNGKLFTEEELAEPIKDYSEYQAKDYFIRNYYPMQIDYVSAFGIFRTEEDEKAHEKKIAGLFYDPISWCYVPDIEFVKRQTKLKAQLDMQFAKVKEDFGFMKSAFLSEMYNHEYGYNLQADYDVINCFANVPYLGDCSGLGEYMKKAGFTDTQKQAYVAARNEYYKATGF